MTHLELIAELAAALDNVLLHHGPYMSKGDVASRRKLIKAAENVGQCKLRESLRYICAKGEIMNVHGIVAEGDDFWHVHAVAEKALEEAQS